MELTKNFYSYLNGKNEEKQELYTKAITECDTCRKRTDCEGRELYEQVKRNWGEGVRCSSYEAEPVKNIPSSLSIEEVKTGQWVTRYNEHGYHKECSVCGARWMLDSVKHICIETPRCYNCGARLKKEDENQVLWSRPGPCPVKITPEQFNAIYNDDEEEESDAT